MKTYKVTEIFKSIQGEGSLVGTVMTFIRFQGCNLSCSFCDTDFSYGTEMTVDEILSQLTTDWVCLTGGEPLLQTGGYQDELMEALYFKHKIAVETNGTIPLTHHGFSHITVSPKVKPSQLKIQSYTDLKVIYPAYEPEIYREWSDRGNLFVQPEYGKEQEAIKYVINNPKWRLSVQTHKLLGIA